MHIARAGKQMPELYCSTLSAYSTSEFSVLQLLPLTVTAVCTLRTGVRMLMVIVNPNIICKATI